MGTITLNMVSVWTKRPVVHKGRNNLSINFALASVVRNTKKLHHGGAIRTALAEVRQGC